MAFVPTPAPRPYVDLAVVGASAGGVEALRAFVGALPADLPCAVCVVLHLSAAGTSVLPAILDRAGPLPATSARDGESLAPGHIHVAVPGHHLEIADGCCAVTLAPRDHGFRPSVDRLMRSAALAYGPRAAGIVLSGTREDGSEGLACVRAAGGPVAVQDPRDAAYPGMPSSALRRTEVDAVLTAAGLAGWLSELCEPGLTSASGGAGRSA